MSYSDYQRAPIPKPARPSVSVIAICWMTFIFSPFIGFYINGKVDGSNWTPALIIASAALSIIFINTIKASINYKKLPLELRDEYKYGKLLPILPKPENCEPKLIPFNKNGTKKICLTNDGIDFTINIRQRTSITLAFEYSKLDNAESSHIPWHYLKEWQVYDDSDRCNYYKLILKTQEYIEILRPTDKATEISLLDYVRSVGQVPVRIFCDI